LNAFFWSFIGVWKRWSNYIFNMKRYHASLKMYFGQRFHTPMKLRASSDLSFIGMWNITFIIMWPLNNQSYCNISMKNGSNVIIPVYLSNSVPFNVMEQRPEWFTPGGFFVLISLKWLEKFTGWKINIFR
jgi:hypothetical protein